MTRRTVEQSKENFKRSLAHIGKDYAEGCKRADWATAVTSDAAETAWEAGVNAAIRDKAWHKAVSKTSNSVWLKGVETKGQQSIVLGIQNSMDKWAKAMSEITAHMSSTYDNLPERTTSITTNMERAKQVAIALHNAGRVYRGLEPVTSS